MKKLLAMFSLSILTLSACTSEVNVKLDQDTLDQIEESVQDAVEEMEEDESVVEIPEGDFNGENSSYSGTAYAKGYAEILEIPMACDPATNPNCFILKYVQFVVTENGTPALENFLADFAGNTYAGDNMIGLGCFEDGRIHGVNANDENVGYLEFDLGGELSDQILNSSEDSQIVLKMIKKPFSGGAGAPECYSHFSEFAVYE